MRTCSDVESAVQGTIRMLMSIGGLVPLPSDALVTPVTFRVKKRKLRGILADFDVAETGTRELSGEWVVGKKTWQRLQAEWKAAHRSQPVKDPFEPTRLPLKTKERVILYIHGGKTNVHLCYTTLTRWSTKVHITCPALLHSD